MEPRSDPGSDREDNFEDASDMSHRNSTQTRSPGRSLTNRSRSTSADTATREEKNEDAVSSYGETTGSAVDGVDEQNHESQAPPSPQSSAKRISVGSMDEVNLEDSNKTPTTSEHVSKPPLPPRTEADKDVASTGLSGKVPINEFPPPPPLPLAPAKSENIAPPPTTRKYTSPFSWLTRNSASTEKVDKNTQPTSATRDRTGTVTSINTINSNPELMVNRLDGEGSESPSTKGSGRNSLKDRFKLLRMREEAGITSLDDELGHGSDKNGGALAGLIGRSMSVGIGMASPGNTADENQGSPPPMHRVRSSPGPHSPSRQVSMTQGLAPGNAAGMGVGPTVGKATPVDWDLWQSVVYEGPAAVARTSAEELNQAIASGIPQAIRGVVWQVLAESKNDDLESMYRELVVRGTDKERVSLPGQTHSIKERGDSIKSSASSIHSNYSTPATTTSTAQGSPLASPSSSDGQAADAIAKLQAERSKRQKEDKAAIMKLEKVIRRDLGARTSYSKYLMSAGLQEGLFGVCKAYALFDEAVGYAQGMNFIAMPLLFNMTEEEAFCLLVKLMNKYGLREMFIQDMPGLHLHLYQFERLLEDFEPALYCHLHRRGVSPQLYATQWFLTLFAYRFPLQLVLRIYDLILSEGLEGAILKFGIVLMQKNAETLLGMKDMSSLSVFLKERIFDIYIDKSPNAGSLLDSGFFGSAGGVDKDVYRADTLVQDACAIKITPEMLKVYTAEWNEKQRIEKERESELENLRQTNADFQKRVRSLEGRIENADIEHVQVASDLVRTKVENENLRDENESLQGQVDELKKIVDKQPQEVEERFKAQLDSLMARNMEVQNSNRSLEEQLAETEKALVESKMRNAETDAENETLKQRWKNLSAMVSGE
ncbi:RabGAP/TBC [Pseudovirgaria hyperparasitica]|uniref:GTPase-activating protein GYP5 n=1 Tax=Pseudovirgaria hyperparasitica TaxID=470096 RepID=A0A6A6WJB5_9PEZI|nr:RabGAP/TBC [Pseudovirgaria hyperparasitica]KAF2762324.1 RabGAP/TBC [Pseudovirgaria hyperparasitica]